MPFKMASKQELSIGIDLGFSSVKAVALNKPGKDPVYYLHDYIIEEIPGVLGNLSLADREQSLLKILGQIANRFGANNNLVNVAVAGQSVIVRYISLPKMTDDELEQAVRFEAEKHIPFNIDEVILDYQILGESELETEQMKILLVAVKKELVFQQVSLLGKAGFDIGVIDIDSFALINAFELNYPEASPDETYALVNIGAERTNINIIKNHVSYFTRDVAIAGNDFSEAISRSLNVNLAEAEKVKLNPSQEQLEIVDDAMGAIFMRLVSEIRLSFDYYENQLERGIDKVFFSGGSTGVPGFGDVLSDKLGVPACAWSPCSQVIVSDQLDAEKIKQQENLLAVALGLALRES